MPVGDGDPRPGVPTSLGECLNLEEGRRSTWKERWGIHRPAPAFDQLESKTRCFETGIKGHRPADAVRAGRQDRPVRWRGVGKTVLIQEMISASPRTTVVCRCSPASASAPVRATTSSSRWRRPGVIGKTALVFGQMDEPPGTRLRVALSGADDGGVLPRRPEPGRAALHRQHLPVHPGRLRGVGAARPDALRRGLPAEPGRRDGHAAGRITSTRGHSITSMQAIYVPADDYTDRRRRRLRAPRRDDGAVARDRVARHLPGRGPADLDLPDLGPAYIGPRPTTLRDPHQARSCSATRSSRTSSRSSVSTSSPKGQDHRVRARRISGSCRRTPTWPKKFTGIEGSTVPVSETIEAFNNRSRTAEFDHVAEQAFFMCGGLDDVEQVGDIQKNL